MSAAAAAAQQPPIMMADYTQPEKPGVGYKPGGPNVLATKCFTNHCGPGVVTGSPLMSKKHPPEPPRRQCSAPGVMGGGPGMEQFVNQFDAITLAQKHQAVQAAAQHYGVPQAYPQYHFSPHLPHNYQHYNNQPVYANFIGGQHQTTVEVHAEKINDSKVRTLVTDPKCLSIPIIEVFSYLAVQLQHRFNRSDSICQ